jgi:hypothetical protein
MDEALRAVRRELLQIVAELKAMKTRLLEVIAVLPEPAGDPEAEAEEMDLTTEIRSVVACVLQDSLGPAARDLQAVTGLISSTGRGGEGIS